MTSDCLSNTLLPWNKSETPLEVCLGTLSIFKWTMTPNILHLWLSFNFLVDVFRCCFNISDMFWDWFSLFRRWNVPPSSVVWQQCVPTDFYLCTIIYTNEYDTFGDFKIGPKNPQWRSTIFYEVFFQFFYIKQWVTVFVD